MVNVLFTSVGRRVELLQAFRRAYESLDLQGCIVATDIDPLAPGLQIADKPYLVPRFTSPDYVNALVEICKRESVNLIFPLIDPDIPVLAHNRVALEAVGARLAVVSSEAVTLTRDKWTTKEFFRQLGLQTAQAWLPGQLDASTANYPLFIKPRDGSAGYHTYRVNNPEEFAFFSRYVPNPIIEEYLPGAEITSDVIAWIDGEVLGVVSRQRIQVRSGEVSKGVTIRDDRIIEACVRIARELPAVGPITVQCIMRDNEPHFTEINARLGGGIPLGIAAGVDSPKWFLALAAGIHLDVPPLGSYKTGLYMSRYDNSFFLSEDARVQMESHRL